jgi:hypothetical protein
MTKEFTHLQELLRNKKAIIGFNKFFIRKTLMLYLDYKNKTVFWILGIFSFLTSGWISIPISIFIAWRFNNWWLIIIGIVVPSIIDEIVKTAAMQVVRSGVSRDENLFEYLWTFRPFLITISSTKMVPKGESFDIAIANLYPKKGDTNTSEAYKSEIDSSKSKGKESKVFICPPQDWRTEIHAKADDFE